jgi:hypothetical protein
MRTGSLEEGVSVRRELEAMLLQDVRAYRRQARRLLHLLRRHAQPCPGREGGGFDLVYSFLPDDDAT